MNVVLWIVAIALAGAFAGAGLMKLTQPKQKLQPNFPYMEDFSDGTIKFIGAAEVLGALGLVLPAVTGIATVLTPLAATGIAIIMLLASVVHARRKEPWGVVFTLVVLALAAFVAWGRFWPYSF